MVVLFYRLLTYYLYLLIGAIVFPRWAAKAFSQSDSSSLPPAPESADKKDEKTVLV